MAVSKFAADYVDVSERLSMFFDAYPDGSLQPADFAEPVRSVTVGQSTFLLYVALAFRNPDDPRPGVGIAWEPFPGKTPYTRDSEAMNAETSAWGRAIVAVMGTPTRRSVASAQEVSARVADRCERERAATGEQVVSEEAQAAKDELRRALVERGADLKEAAARFRADFGESLKDTADVAKIREFAASVQQQSTEE